MWSESTYRRVIALVETGLGDRAIAPLVRVPRSTVNHWRNHPRRRLPPVIPQDWRPADPSAYSYLLGMYLGDGHLRRSSKNSMCFSLSLDELYGGIVEEAAASVVNVLPGVHVCRYSPSNCRKIVLSASSCLWAVAVPQHGPGKKHERPIVLLPWQLEITHEHPRMFLRGLIHSDGCRCMNRFKTRLPSGRIAQYEYPRYFFSNLSADIRRLFSDHCDLLGIRWSLSNPRNVSVSHRDSVALLDSFVGPKS